jgi:DNA polymerase sigma
MKTLSSFDIRNAVGEIIEIQEDKVRMKSIQIEEHYKGFESLNYKVFTD